MIDKKYSRSVNVFYVPLLIAAILFSISILFAADSGLQLVHADKTIGQKQGSEQLRFFEGAVHFHQDTLDMFCDKAVYYTKQNRIDFTGSVHLLDGRRTIDAQKVEYYPDTRLAVCMGDVRIRNGQDSLSAGYFAYNFKSSRVEAEKKVYIQDRKHLVQIWGEKSLYLANTHFARVENKTKLMRIDSLKNDTLLITAGKLEYQEQKPTQAMATDSVWIRQDKLKARCDTAIYFVDDEKVLLSAQPQAWYEDNAMSGRRIRIQLDSMEVKTIHISEKAKAVSLADSVDNSWNVLKGKEIHLTVLDKKPQQLQAAGNASSVYYLEDDQEKHGVNFATSDTIRIYFKTGKADSISILGGSEGVYYPENYKGEKAFENQGTGAGGRIKKP